MKKLRFLIPFILLLCCVAAFSACSEKPALSRPTGVTVEEASLTLKWKEVQGARRYTVSINDSLKNTTKNTYSLLSLTEGDYEIKVKACAAEGTVQDSEWSVSVNFTREHETGLELTLAPNHREYTVTGMGSAEGEVVIPDTYRGKPVTGIGEKAFSVRSKLTGVTLGANIVSIGATAFNSCQNLEYVAFNDGLTSIGEKAFQSCYKLTEIVIPDSVTEIGENAFNYCNGITGLTIGNGVKSIGATAFANCTKLAQIVIPDSVESVGNYAFSACESATSMKMGSGITEIGEYVFARCRSLEQVEIGKNVRSIGSFAFTECFLLERVVLPESVRSIGFCAFMSCKSLSDINIDQTVETILTAAFMDTALWASYDNFVYAGNWLLGIKRDTKASYTASDFKEGLYGIASSAFSTSVAASVILPDSVKIISDYAFDACENLSQVIIGSGVTEIATYAFNDCAKLTSVILGAYDFATHTMGESSLELIGDSAFNGCTALADIVIPDTVKSVGSNVFAKTALYNNASGIVYADKWVVGYHLAAGINPNYSETVKEGTLGIADYAFYNVTTIESIYIPDSVKTIGRGAFYNCEYVTEVRLPAGIERIEDYTFYKCKYLMDIDLYYIRNLKYIGRSAFYQCELVGLTETANPNNVIFSIPDSVEEIGDYAFYGCGQIVYDEEGEIENIFGINTLLIGSGVKRIGNFAFYRFLSLKTVLVGSNVESIGEKAFYRNERLETVSFGENLKSIGTRAFYGCTSLKKVAVPDSVVTLGDYAFYKCAALTDLSLGESVQTIGKYAFYGCGELNSLRLSSSVQSIGKQAFRNCVKLTSVAIGENVATLDAHVFYGCTDLTVYAEATTQPAGWNARWNSSYRPVVWGATLSDDKAYVISFNKTADAVTGVYESTLLRAPTRAGYTFEGWTDVPGGTVAKYTAEGIALAPNDGATWYAVWTVSES